MTPIFSKCFERQTTQVELLMQIVDIQVLPLLGRGQDPTAPAPRSCLLVVQMGRPPNPWGLKNQGALSSQWFCHLFLSIPTLKILMSLSELEQDLYSWNLWDWNKIGNFFELNSNIFCESLWLRVIIKMTLGTAGTIVVCRLWFRSHQQKSLTSPLPTLFPRWNNVCRKLPLLHHSSAYGLVKNSTREGWQFRPPQLFTPQFKWVFQIKMVLLFTELFIGEMIYYLGFVSKWYRKGRMDQM